MVAIYFVKLKSVLIYRKIVSEYRKVVSEYGKSVFYL